MELLKCFVLFVVVAGVAASFEEKEGNRLSRMIKPKGHLRARRSLYDFYRMIKCETGRPPSDYNGYGCWCGKGGDGKILDDLDRCCYVHDHCYGEARKSGKCTKWLQIYWDSYDILGCSDCHAAKNDDCEQALCECDRDAARCFANNHWDSQYDNYPKDKC